MKEYVSRTTIDDNKANKIITEYTDDGWTVIEYTVMTNIEGNVVAITIKFERDKPQLGEQST